MPDPLGSYIRPGYKDGPDVLQLLVEGRSIASGLVANPTWGNRQADLMTEAGRQGLETVLDPLTVDLGTAGGFGRGRVRNLPWAGNAPHLPDDLTGLAGVPLVRAIAEEVQARGYSAVLAPTHFLSAADDPWLLIDADLTHRLRAELDRLGLGHVRIYYPLVVKAEVFRHAEARGRLVQTLRPPLPIDAVWLRIHPFGTNSSGPLALRRYLEGCRDLHATGVPLVAEHSGTVGLALMAFGAVGGIESGITFSEGVQLGGLFKAPDPDDRGFSPAPRIYLHQLGTFLPPERGEAFFGARGMKSAHGCTNSGCCPRGWQDMQMRPRRHFLLQRAHEVATLSATPPPLRAGLYMENFLRPASDRAVRAAEIEPSLEPARKRLDSWRGTLGAQLEKHSVFTVSEPAAGKRLRRPA
ncbi:hypothetical protein [Blastococcus aurantiacus]|nr:hypothetical protein [Blastococcus aurantiacus]